MISPKRSKRPDNGIIDCSKVKPIDLGTVDILVIGSGYAGATAAMLFAEAGREVIVIEEGPDLTGDQLNQHAPAMYDQLYMDRGGRTTDDLSISVLQGRALGGGGVVNMCDVVPLENETLQHWQKKYGLSELTLSRLAPHMDAALKDLSATTIPPGSLNEGNRLLMQGAQKLGWRGQTMMHNRKDCIGIGTCTIGCPADAKFSTRFYSIPRSISSGATYYLRTRATVIEGLNEELKTVKLRHLDSQGYHETATTKVKARTVIIACNAVNSVQLLLRSGYANPHLGRHLSLQPQLPIVARYKHEINAHIGIPQAFAITEFEEPANDDHGLSGFRIEAIFSNPSIVASMLPFIGPENFHFMRMFTHMAGALLLVPDENSGSVSLDGYGSPVITYDQSPDHRRRTGKAARAASESFFAAGADLVIVPTNPAIILKSTKDIRLIPDLATRKASAPLISAHQQATIRMSNSPDEGVCDQKGLLYQTNNVFIYDSSIFPTSASSHLMAPIITFARFFGSSFLGQ